jgi:hypothetical protein
MQKISDWKKLGMPEYTERFAKQRIEIDVLRELYGSLIQPSWVQR